MATLTFGCRLCGTVKLMDKTKQIVLFLLCTSHLEIQLWWFLFPFHILDNLLLGSFPTCTRVKVLRYPMHLQVSGIGLQVTFKTSFKKPWWLTTANCADNTWTDNREDVCEDEGISIALGSTQRYEIADSEAVAKLFAYKCF